MKRNQKTNRPLDLVYPLSDHQAMRCVPYSLVSHHPIIAIQSRAARESL